MDLLKNGMISKKKYLCKFYDKDNKDSLYARYSDFGKKVFNYNKNIKYPLLSKEYKYQIISNEYVEFTSLHYISSSSLWEHCKLLDESPATERGDKEKIKDENGMIMGYVNHFWPFIFLILIQL